MPTCGANDPRRPNSDSCRAYCTYRASSTQVSGRRGLLLHGPLRAFRRRMVLFQFPTSPPVGSGFEARRDRRSGRPIYSWRDQSTQVCVVSPAKAPIDPEFAVVALLQSLIRGLVDRSDEVTIIPPREGPRKTILRSRLIRRPRQGHRRAGIDVNV